MSQITGLEEALFTNLLRVHKVGSQGRLRWETKVLESGEGLFFFIRSSRKEGRYEVDILMKGSQEDCEDFMVEASILNVETRKPVFKCTLQPRPLTDQDEAIYCLSVPEKGLSKAWKYSQIRGKFTILYSVGIFKLT